MRRYRGTKRRFEGSSRMQGTDPDDLSASSTSESSDILVAVAPAQSLPQRRQPTAPKMPVTAKVTKGRLVIRGVAGLLKQLVERDYQRDNDEAANRYLTSSGQVGNHSNDHGISPAVGRDISPLGEDDRGPNHKGTYSKKFTLLHPEVKWVHRGQGRYLPTGNVSPGRLSATTVPTTVTSTPQRRSTQTSRLPARSSLRRQRSDDANDYEDDQDEERPPRSVPQASPESRRTRARPSEALIPTPSEQRAARLNRRSQPVFSIEGGGSMSDASDASDEAESDGYQSRTYSKDYVDSHPEITWRHCGNGFYKKGSRLAVAHDPVSVSLPSRRGSNRSLVKAESISHDTDQSRRYHSSELRDYPNEKFRHCGNGWYRIESESVQSPDDYATDIDEDEMTPLDGKFTKEQMIAYKNRFPNAEFDHRGNGKYVLAEESPQATQTPAAMSVKSFVDDPKQTYDKAYVKEHPSEEFHHAGSGRYRRGPRPTPIRPSEVPSNDESEDIGKGLVNKDYTVAHPHLEFHHRGQGRYAFGPRPIETPAAAPTPIEMEPTASPAYSDSELVDTAHVNAHPEETFHHRGQGRWARGLPAPGSSNKTAIRGPLAHTAKLSRTPSSNAPPAFKNVKLPGLEDLLIRSEGPEKFPYLEWVYRGGGKWARTPKEKKPSVQQSASRASNVRSRKLPSDDEDDDGPQTQLDHETQAAGAADIFDTPSNGRYPTTNGIQRAEPKQRRRALVKTKQTVAGTSKNSSQRSKTATPKPVRLTLEEDPIAGADFPELYAERWPEPEADDDKDEAAELMRELYKPLNSAQLFQDALTKRDVATRPKEVLQALTAHVQAALRQIQDEYLALDKITAPHARIARKPAKGGRLPIDEAIFEDKKEAELYDYNFDARKIGYQDPEGQKIVRDADGRELRKRRNRSGLDVDPAYATPGSEDIVLGPRRATKPVNRFDGVTVAAPTRRKRTTTGTIKTVAGSMTPDPAFGASTSSAPVFPDNYVPPTTGRWAGHVPKRIRELRGDSMGSAQSSGVTTPLAEEPPVVPAPMDGALEPPALGSQQDTPGLNIQFDPSGLTVPYDTPGLSLAGDGMLNVRMQDGTPGFIRKGRPKGSKNLRKRRDAGIPKGPRKPKIVPSIENLLAPVVGSAAHGNAVPQTEAGARAGDAMEVDQTPLYGAV